MPEQKSAPLSRRDFLQTTALSLGALAVAPHAVAQAREPKSISLVVEPADAIASATPSKWAIDELSHALQKGGSEVHQFESLQQAPQDVLCIVAAGRTSALAAGILKQTGLSVPDKPECLALAPAKYQGRSVLLACGSDARGLTYALLELADRVKYGGIAQLAFNAVKPLAEQPFNETRSIGKSFVSDVEDKPWFNDREMWPAYFSMLATQRFNRFCLNFGIGFDFLEHVLDSYLLFAYPFLLAVPGYNVRAVPLPDAERDQNLATLQYISQQCVDHGIDFQLGIWTHGYQWKDTPHSNYTIEGLTPDNHAAYSHDALAALLKACPAISGVTIRTHGESGVPEGSYGFWATVFDGVKQSGRTVEIDLHTKGLDQKMIDGALATGMPVRLSPKYWAEHMGLPYHQTAIRELELPHEKPQSQFFSLSTGSRSFTRYGYADFMREDRPYKVMPRIWPGTHRFLLWGDPVSTAAHAHAFTFCGMNGVELYEPLSFKGRRGSGLPGGRCAYADASLNPHYDWEKYLYTYRVWGRLLYNPKADPEVYRRYLRLQFLFANAPAIESALASATRIVPLITAAHDPSAANDAYNPEYYVNQSIVTPSQHPYGDTPPPKIFSNVSPLDPQMFSRMSDFAAELLKGERTGKYSPVEVAQWLEDLSDAAASELAKVKSQAGSPEMRRAALDLKLQIGLGRFFGAKLRAGTLYAIHDQSNDRAALEQALKSYRRAREIWSSLAEQAKGMYAADITYGPNFYQRGHWLDRLPAIDSDIADMAKLLDSPQNSPAQSEQVRSAIQQVVGRPQRYQLACKHTPPAHFVAGQPLALTLTIEKTAPVSARLYYRHVNQAERYETADFEAQGKEFRAAIPAGYAGATYPLQYYFELREGPSKAWLYPGFAPDLANQPYFVVRPAKS